MGHSLCEILCGLWLGDINGVMTSDLVSRGTLFVSVCRSDASTYRVFVRDILDRLVVVNSLSKQCCEISSRIDSELRAGGTVVVFCEFGHQRSPSLIACYLIRQAGMTAPAATACIKSKATFALHEECCYGNLLKELEGRGNM